MEEYIVYKFMNNKYRDRFLSGESIRVGTLSDFRGMDLPGSSYFEHTEVNPFSQEAHTYLTPKGGIDDPCEGRTVVHVEEMRSWDPEHREAAKITKDKLGIDVFGVFGEGYTTIRNNLYVPQVPNCYIFCTSSWLYPATVSRLKEDGAKYGNKDEPYDTIIPIIDSVKFMLKLREALCAVIGIEDPETTRMVCKSVEYENRIYSVGDKSAKLPDPFTKHKFFESQCEYRFLLDYRLPDEEKSVNVSFGNDIDGIFGNPIELYDI